MSGGFGLAGLELAGLELAAGPAGAQPGLAPQEWWYPGQPIPRGALWNIATCHQCHFETGADGTQVAVQGPAPQSWSDRPVVTRCARWCS